MLHIGVPARVRGRGTGRRLLAEVLTAVGATEIFVQTDTDAVGFYRACGFAASSLGDMYPGVERFERRLGA
jgi:GNAT superfamily N-acetyltransferase